MPDCIFCQIANGGIPTDFLYEDEDIVAFRDLDPKAPLHLLLVPKRHIASAAALTAADGPWLGKLFAVAASLCAELGITNGYRIVTNVGEDGGQSVAHLHFHLLAGRALGWPPG